MCSNKNVYSLYFGGYDEKHNQPLTLIEKTSKKLLMVNIQRLLDILPYGLDLYVKKPNQSVYAWHRDLGKCSEKEIEEILK